MKVSIIALTAVVTVFSGNQFMVPLHAFSLQSQGYAPVRRIKNVPTNHFHPTFMSVSPMEETESSSSSNTSSSASTNNNRMKMSRNHMQRIDEENNSEAAVESAASHRTGRSRHEIENELASGRILDDGPVIDFGSIKDTSSKAERALAQAREDYLAAVQSMGKHAVKLGFAGDGNNRLMGINDEVVVEVGREVGAFVKDDAMVQRCAAYLRSSAPKGMFQEHTDAPVFSSEEMKSMDVAAMERLLHEAYEESGLVTEAFAKTFYLGTQLLPTPAQRAIWAIYVWCRRTDEIVDAPRKPEDVGMLTDLSAWEIRLENLFRYGIVEDVLDLPLLDCKIKYPNLPIEPFVDMVRGMLMDIPDLGQDRYETFEELHLYCYRVAGTVGLMSMPVFGCAKGYTEEEAK
jgi:Phytoene/squalene synthetase